MLRRQLTHFTASAFCFLLFGFVGGVMEIKTSVADEVGVWVGTTTPRDGMSKGIYHARFDTASGKLTTPTLAAEISSPGFLAKHPTLDVLYSVGSLQGKASVAAYHSDASTGTLELINSIEIGDGGAAHVSVDPQGRFLLTAQYGGGSTGMFPLDGEGQILPRSGLVKHGPGSGVVAKRQEKSHAHWTGYSPDNRFAFVPDLGLDKVVIWDISGPSPALKLHGYGVCPPGGGPRHMKFSVDGKRVYVLNELALSVTVFDYDAAAGTMNAVQTVPTLSEAVKASETFNSASEIRVHPSGKFVYSANRGNDTITAFKVDPANGHLSVIEVQPIRGGWPRNFNLDPTGKWLIVAGRESNTLTVFSINADSGELTYTREAKFVPTPICVVID